MPLRDRRHGVAVDPPQLSRHPRSPSPATTSCAPATRSLPPRALSAIDGAAGRHPRVIRRRTALGLPAAQRGTAQPAPLATGARAAGAPDQIGRRSAPPSAPEPARWIAPCDSVASIAGRTDAYDAPAARVAADRPACPDRRDACPRVRHDTPSNSCLIIARHDDTVVRAHRTHDRSTDIEEDGRG